MQSLLYIFLGGGLGSLCRFAFGKYFADYGTHFPWHTFLANIVACAILGVLVGYELKHGLKNDHKLLLATGFCGGFSTFSTFSAESVKLMNNGQLGIALFYIGVSIIAGLAAIYIGLKLTL